jgi:hypothetical protein
MINQYFIFAMLRKSADGIGGVDPSRSAPVNI